MTSSSLNSSSPGQSSFDTLGIRESMFPILESAGIETSGEDGTPQRPKMLEALGSRLITLKCFLSKKARNLPILGRSIGYVEDRVNSLLDPVIENVEKESLSFLSIVDDKIYAVSDVAMAHVPLASKVIPQLQILLSGQPAEDMLSVLERVQTRGLVGFTADMWVEYEPIVKNKSQRLYNVAHKIPGLNIVVLILKDVSIPLVTWASDWLVMHSEIKDKHEIMQTRDISMSPVDSSETRDKESKADEQLQGEGNGPSNVRNYPNPESTEFPEKSHGEIHEVPDEDDEPAKGKFPVLSVVHEDEEADELSDLFDTWGLGVNAITPRGLDSLRTKSFGEATGSGPHAKRYTTISRSSRW